MSQSSPVRVQLVEDSTDDATLLTRALVSGGFAPTSERVETARARDRALRRVQELAELQRAMIDNADTWLSGLDPAGRALRRNRTAARLSGVADTGSIGPARQAAATPRVRVFLYLTCQFSCSVPVTGSISRRQRIVSDEDSGFGGIPLHGTEYPLPCGPLLSFDQRRTCTQPSCVAVSPDSSIASSR